MYGLAVDTSSKSGSLALCQVSVSNHFKIIDELLWNKKNSHSEVITKYSENLLSKNQINWSQIKLLALGIGPGSFTGIRVALNFAKAMSYSLDIPIFPCHSLLPLAYSVDLKEHPDKLNVLVIQNAFKNMVYCSGFNLNPFKEVCSPFSCRPEEILNFIEFDLSKTLIIGNGYSLYEDYFPEKFKSKCKHVDSSQNIAVNLLEYYFSLPDLELKKWNQIVPLYIRKSEAEEKLGL